MTAQQPEGRLIADAMADRHLSARKAAALVGLSDARLRQIINGYASVGQGQRIPVSAPATTLARIGEVLGISPSAFAEAGREDVAVHVAEHVHDFGRAHIWSDDHAIDELRVWLDGATGSGPSTGEDYPPDGCLVLWSDEQLLQALADRLVAQQMEIQTYAYGRALDPPHRVSVGWSRDPEAEAWYEEMARQIAERKTNIERSEPDDEPVQQKRLGLGTAGAIGLDRQPEQAPDPQSAPGQRSPSSSQ